MKILPLFCLLPALALPVAAATTTQPAAPAKPAPPTTHATTASAKKPASAASKPAVAASQTAAPAPAPAAAAPVAKPGMSLDAYIATLADDVPLSKDEQTDIKTYYLDDGATLQDILNDASLSPLEQTQQVDDLRHARNDKIAALLHDADRQKEFLLVEANYRVALVELAAKGGLIPATPPPRVPEPTSTTPAQADTPAPAM
jgi:hypothetical protein